MQTIIETSQGPITALSNTRKDMTGIKRLSSCHLPAHSLQYSQQKRKRS